MPISPIFAHRSAKDTDYIVSLGVKKMQNVKHVLQREILQEFQRGNQFSIEAYIVKKFTPLMVNIQLAAHLSGFRRFRLTLLQSPSLKRRYESGLLKHPAIKTLELANSDTFNKAIKVLQSRVGLDIEALSAQYETEALEVMHGVGAMAESKLRDVMEELTARGAHLKDAKESFAGVFDSLGITPGNSFTIENIFRTQTQLAFGAGKWQAEQDEAVQEILWGYKYVTVGDDRVRDDHALMEGVTLPKNDPFWLRFYPPNGWSCRCQAIPIFETMKSVKPPTFGSDGVSPLAPDTGFNFNPGIVFAGKA